jgi:hypothetical protein
VVPQAVREAAGAFNALASHIKYGIEQYELNREHATTRKDPTDEVTTAQIEDATWD